VAVPRATITARNQPPLPLHGTIAQSGSGKATQADVKRWANELSNWGRWGSSDQLGTVNLITPTKRIEAAALVTRGLSVSLAHNDSTEPAVDNKPPFGHKMLTTGADPSAEFAMDQYIFTYHTLFFTHLDALCHVFYGDKLYNGFPRRSVTATGAQKLDVLQLKNGIFTRGLLFDIPRLKGKPYLEREEAIYPEDLDRWEKKAGVAVEPGDVVLIRTGRWARRKKLGPYGFPAAGLYVTCARWLHQHDVAVLGSDNASDVMPSGVDGVSMPIHLLAIASMGMPILDNCDLEQLAEVAAEQHRWVFLLTVAPEPVPGGTGSPVNPTAVF
jgi:kynurenine formamidase